MRFVVLFFLVVTPASNLPAQPPTSLEGFSFCIDPGHGASSTGGYLNVGIYGYSETEKVLSIAFHMKQLLESSGADTVILTRMSNNVNPTLTSRTAIANNNNVDWFTSVHSNASGSSSTNYVIILIEERREYSDDRQSTSDTRGLGLGVAYWRGESDVLAALKCDKIARGYRIPNSGVRLDWTFFGGTNGGFTLGVLRTSLMPADLTEGGFHTDPTQNLRNMNEQYKRLEARTHWMTYLQYFGVQRPPVRTLVGIITDKTTGQPLNEAYADVQGKTYKTNSYYDTFYRWQVPDTSFGNGVYYFEDLVSASPQVTFRKVGYRDTTVSVALADTFVTFKDVAMTRVVTSITDGRDDIAKTFALKQNYPNPFNPTTIIPFDLPARGHVTLDIIDILGHEVAVLLNNDYPHGRHQAVWDGTTVGGTQAASGIYFSRIRFNGSMHIRKILLMR